MGLQKPFSIDRAQHAKGIVFSLKKGQVWAHWLDADVSVRLGEADAVTDMMRDFIAQMALGERMLRGEWGKLDTSQDMHSSSR